MKRRISYSLFTLLFFISMLNLASAVPQIFTTNFNLTITGNQTGNTTSANYYIYGEGGQMVNTFPVNGICNFSYSINNIPLTFSRDITQNETDLSRLLKMLADGNFNVTRDWQECNRNLTWCMMDTGYKQNYTDCSTQLSICRSQADTYANQITEKNKQITEQTQQKWIAVGAAVIAGILAWNLGRKTRVKTAKLPISELPSGRVFT